MPTSVAAAHSDTSEMRLIVYLKRKPTGYCGAALRACFSLQRRSGLANGSRRKMGKRRVDEGLLTCSVREQNAATASISQRGVRRSKNGGSLQLFIVTCKEVQEKMRKRKRGAAWTNERTHSDVGPPLMYKVPISF